MSHLGGCEPLGVVTCPRKTKSREQAVQLKGQFYSPLWTKMNLLWWIYFPKSSPLVLALQRLGCHAGRPFEVQQIGGTISPLF